jgi:hypothetical protein
MESIVAFSPPPDSDMSSSGTAPGEEEEEEEGVFPSLDFLLFLLFDLTLFRKFIGRRMYMIWIYYIVWLGVGVGRIDIYYDCDDQQSRDRSRHRMEEEWFDHHGMV